MWPHPHLNFADVRCSNPKKMSKDTSSSVSKKEQGLFEEDDEFEEFPTEGE